MYKLSILCLKEYGSEGCRDLAIDLRNNKYTIKSIRLSRDMSTRPWRRTQYNVTCRDVITAE
jgi:hypothetical protein